MNTRTEIDFEPHKTVLIHMFGIYLGKYSAAILDVNTQWGGIVTTTDDSGISSTAKHPRPATPPGAS